MRDVHGALGLSDPKYRYETEPLKVRGHLACGDGHAAAQGGAGYTESDASGSDREDAVIVVAKARRVQRTAPSKAEVDNPVPTQHSSMEPSVHDAVDRRCGSRAGICCELSCHGIRDSQ